MLFRKILLILNLLFIFIFNVLAAETGSIAGRIIDQQTKQPLIGASVTIQGTALGCATNLNGDFKISNIPEEVYTVQVTYLGYNPYAVGEVRVIRNKSTFMGEIEMVQSGIALTPVVFSTGAFHDDEEVPVSNYSYSQDELLRSPGAAGDVFRAISTLPGASIGSGGEFAAFSVRGGSPQENFILIDDIPFEHVAHLEGGGTEEELGQGGRFSIFSPYVIGKVDFQAGGFPAAYGGKNASLINLNVKDGNRDTPSTSVSADLFGVEGTYNGPSYIHKNTSVMLSARHVDLGVLLGMIGEEGEGRPVFSDFILKTTTHINHTHKISLLGIYAPETYDRNADDMFKSEDLNSNFIAYNDVKRGLLGLNWRMLTSKNSFLKTSVYVTDSEEYIRDGRAITDPVNGVDPTPDNVVLRDNIISFDRNELTSGGKTEFMFTPSDRVSFNTGLEFRHTKFDFWMRQNGVDTFYVYDEQDYRPDPDQKFLVVDPQDVNSYYNETLNHGSAFTQASVTVTPSLIITPGVRLDYYDYNEDTYLSPRVSARYRFDSKTNLNAAFGVYYQNPDYQVIASDDLNRNLKNEQSIHYILGASRYLTDELKLNVETYYKTFDDVLVRYNRNSNVYSNDGDGWATGIDLSLIRRLTDKFFGQVSYSYAISKRDDHNGEGEYDSDFNKPHIFNIMGGYEFNKRWKISANWQFASGYPTDSYIVHSDVHNNPNYLRYSKEITGNNDERLVNSHTLNVRVDYRRQLNNMGLVVFLDVLNIYDNQNVTEERFMERTGGIDEVGFHMLPSIGVKLEF